MHITFVKKILADGELCKKCREVSDRIKTDNLIEAIDHIAIADERDPESEGMLLATAHNVSRAPFFIVTQESGSQVFDIYFKFKAYLQEHGYD